MARSIPHVRLSNDTIHIGRFFSVNFQRTIRLPNDGHDYPLPPGFGSFPLRAVADYQATVPAEWRERGGYFLPMHRHEAMWLSFRGAHWHPVALRIDVGDVCALTGDVGAVGILGSPQNYMVVPDQPWIDGIKAGEGIIRQFVASPLGEGQTIEAQVAGKESTGGIRLTLVEAKRGLFPERAPNDLQASYGGGSALMVCESASSMGLGAGGRMVQKIYPDRHGFEVWNPDSSVSVDVHLVDARDWGAITREDPPPSPISIQIYKQLRLPWFALADGDLSDIDVAPALSAVLPVNFD